MLLDQWVWFDFFNNLMLGQEITHKNDIPG